MASPSFDSLSTSAQRDGFLLEKTIFIVSRIGLGKAPPAWFLPFPTPHARCGRSGAESAESMVSRGRDALIFNDTGTASPRLHEGTDRPPGKTKSSSQASHHWLAADHQTHHDGGKRKGDGVHCVLAKRQANPFEHLYLRRRE